MTENKYGTATGHPYITDPCEPQVSLQKCLCYLHILLYNMERRNITKPMELEHFYRLLGFSGASGASAMMLRSLRGFKLAKMLNDKEKNPHVKKLITISPEAKKLVRPPSPTASKETIEEYENLLRSTVFSHELFKYLYTEQRLRNGILRKYVRNVLTEMRYWDYEIPKIITSYTLSIKLADKPYSDKQQHQMKTNEWWPMYECSVDEIIYRLKLRHVLSPPHNSADELSDHHLTEPPEFPEPELSAEHHQPPDPQ